MFKKIENVFRGFHKDEEGQALPFFTIFSLVLCMCFIVNFNVGKTVSEKMRAQNVADAASYSAAVWQARFLNYCAYTRRAIVANWCNIAAMNVVKSNNRMFERIANEEWFASDTSGGKTKDDNGLIKTYAEIIHTAMDIVELALFDIVDMRKVAEQMNNIMANSQWVMYASVADPEAIMEKVAADAGGIGEFEIDNFNLVPSIPISMIFNVGPINDFLQPNMEISQLLERRKIPVNEIRWQFDRYTLPLLPFNGSGAFIVPGRKWNAAHWQCSNMPFYATANIKWAKPQFPMKKSPFTPKMSLIRPYADIMDNQEESDAGPRNDGNWIVSHEGKGKHRAEDDDKKLLGAHVFWIKKVDKQYCIPEIFFDFYSGGSTEHYELIYNINDIEVFEIKDPIPDEEKLEPSVYCMVRRKADQIGYLEILGLESPHDVMAVSRAKVNFVSPDENLNSNRISTPNLNYPFWTASLAPFDLGRNSGGKGSLLGGITSPIKVQFMLKEVFVTPFIIPRGLEY